MREASKRSMRHYLVFWRAWESSDWQQFTQVEAGSRSEAIDLATLGPINSGYFVAVPLSGWKVEMRPQIGQEGCG